MSSKPAPKTPAGRSIGPKERKIAVLGARSVGKSSLILQFVEGHFIDSYYPTIEQPFYKTTSVKGTEYALEILDTAGLDETSFLSNKQVFGIHGWIMVFAVDNRSSFQRMYSIRDKLLSQLGTDSVPLVLVGNKSDLDDRRKVKQEEITELAKEWKCASVETSAKECSNVDRVFENLVTEIEKSTNPQSEPAKWNCTIS